VGSNLGQANVLKAIGDVQSFRKEMDAALNSYGEAQALFKQVGSNLGQANVLQAIGDVQSFRKEMDAALNSYGEAQALFKQVGDNLGQANVLLALGRINDDVESFEQALALYKQIGDRYSTARCQYFFGLSRKEAGDRDRARQLLLESREGSVATYPPRVELIDEALTELEETGESG
jgi:tetratricopeptide (TPR) repeat protein